MSLAAVVLAAAVNAVAVAGHWEGTLQRGAAHVAASVDFPPGEPLHATFSAPDLGAVDVPLSAVREDGAVHFELIGDASTTSFDGTATGDAMSSTFRDGTSAGTFAFTRSSLSTDKPYATSDVTFAGGGGVTLAGTVYAPRSPGKHAALVFVHGSGPEGRWASKPLADYVARHGIVALVYDKRGVGASTGDWKTATTDDLIADARGGVALLAKRADVDALRVGVYGHSQGAMLAPGIAQGNSGVNWIVAADGPVGPEYRQDLWRVDTMLASRYSGDALRDAEALYAEFVDTARTGASHAQLRADVAKAAGAPWLDDLDIPADDSWIWPFYRATANYDDSAAWAAVRVPVLVLFGGNDRTVPEADSVAQTTAILRKHDPAHVEVRVFPGADHTLRVPPATADAWPLYADGFPGIIVEFARRAF
jgi:hypothetical protein